jgi:FkbM family methyltransferase
VDLVLDVGANQGQFASGLRQYGYKGEIISFEPVTNTYNILLQSRGQDSRWKTEKMALGDKKERKEIRIPNSTGMTSFLAASDYAIKTFPTEIKDYVTESIDIGTLEDYLETNKIDSSRRIFLKIDTQGYDMNVLLGAKKWLPHIVGVSTELSFVQTYENMPTYLDVLSFLQSHNFVVSNMFQVFFDRELQLLVESDCVTINKKFIPQK